MKKVIVRKTGGSAMLRTIESIAPVARPEEVIVDVHSISLNRGEVTRALHRAEDGWAPGWDFSGTVVQASKDGEGPTAGTRVVGFKEAGGWAERVAIDARHVAEIPPDIDFGTAATLPIAGLTALYALEKGGSLAGKRVLITGATGGMGQFAVQLALMQGACVTAAVFHNALPPSTHAARLRVVRMDEAGLLTLRRQQYDLVIESVGGDVFTAALESLAPDGLLISLGVTRDCLATVDLRTFFTLGRVSMYGFLIFDEVARKPAAPGLRRLMRLLQSGVFHAPIAYSGTIDELDRVARDLLDSKIPGKAVLRWAA